MAIIYYVKDGPRTHNSDSGRELPLQTLEARTRGQQVRYLGTTPPEFNKNTPSPYYRHVVVEVESQEPPGQIFDKVGFFLLLDSSPDQAEPMIFQGDSPPYRV